MNPKYKDDIKVVLGDISKDAGLIIAFIAIVMGINFFIHNYDVEDPLRATFIQFPLSVFIIGPLGMFVECRFLLIGIIVEFLFASIFFALLYLSKTKKLKMILILISLVVLSAFLLIFNFHIITGIAVELIFMALFFVPLFLSKLSESTLFIIVLLVVLCSCLFCARICYNLPIVKYMPIVLFALLFIILYYKNIPLNKSKWVIITLLLIQTLDFFFMLSLIDKVPSAILILIVIGIYKIVVLLFRYRKYKEAKIFSNILIFNNQHQA